MDSSDVHKSHKQRMSLIKRRRVNVNTPTMEKVRKTLFLQRNLSIKDVKVVETAEFKLAIPIDSDSDDKNVMPKDEAMNVEKSDETIILETDFSNLSVDVSDSNGSQKKNDLDVEK